MITKSYGPVKAEKFVKSTLKNRKTASVMIRQTVTSTYAAQNSTVDSLFAGTGTSFKQDRVMCIPVPEGVSLEQVQAQLNTNPEATIWKTISHDVILTDELTKAIELGYTTIAEQKERQLAMDPKDSSKPLLDRVNGKVQYRRHGFSLKRHEDVDLRVYTPAEQAAKAVLATAAAKKGQTI